MLKINCIMANECTWFDVRVFLIKLRDGPPNDWLFASFCPTVPYDFCVGKDPSKLYSAPDNCAQWIRCPLGEGPVTQTCQRDFLWNTEVYECLPPEKVDCGDRPSKLILLLYAHQRKKEFVTWKGSWKSELTPGITSENRSNLRIPTLGTSG